jgi:cysteine-rich repeat protein
MVGATCVEASLCGDGVIQAGAGEECDGTNLDGSTCEDQGFYGGTLTCDASCIIDLSGCAGACGDGEVQPAQEDCDGSDLDGETCASLSFDSGILSCDSSCGFDTSACVGPTCGNGTIEGAETCDDGNTQGTDGCDATCQVEAGFECTGEPSICTLLCGNGQIDAGEACDSTDFGSATCADFGYYGGTLTCAATCDASDQTACVGYCGDGVANGTEACDATDFGSETCQTYDFYSGSLSCTAACDQVLTTGCSETCGDGVVNGPEECDTTDFGSDTCADFGYYGGTLTCAATCDASDQTACVGYCGDGVVNGTEVCDDGNPTSGDGCDATCLVEDGWGCEGEPSVCYLNPGSGEVIITEILYDASAFGEPAGEWLEVQNVSSATVVLNGCIITDTEGEFEIDSLLLPPGAFAVFAHTDNSGVTGWTPDFVYGAIMTGSFILANTGDDITLQCPDGMGGDVTVDDVTYGNSSPFPSQQAGYAISLDPLIQSSGDNDHGGHWCHAADVYGGGEYGTPGAENPLCDDTIDWCRLQWPASVNTTVGTPFTVFARVYEAGITDETDTTDPSDAIVAEIGYAPDGSDPVTEAGAWTWVPANPNAGYDGTAAGEPNNDEYQTDIAINTPGTWDYAARFSRDGGVTWLYCDLDDSSNGYQISQAGDAVVN